jgi:hypothetical protein
MGSGRVVRQTQNVRRRVLVLVLLAGCTRETAPKARLAGEIMSISSVAGLIAGAATQGETSHTSEIMVGFSLTSIVGLGLAAGGQLLDPAPGPRPETAAQTHLRWAKILTERAGGAAREGNCRRVRRLEKRVNVYNRDVHDFVFMRDPEIVKCLEAPPAPEGLQDRDVPTVPRGVDPGPIGPSAQPPQP